MNAPLKFTYPKSDYDIKMTELFENQEEVRRIFKSVFQDWCFKNTQEANALFQKLHKKHPSLPLRDRFFAGDVSIAIETLIPAINAALNKAKSKRYTLFEPKLIDDILLLSSIDGLRESLVQEFIRVAFNNSLKGMSYDTVLMFINARINNFLGDIKVPEPSPELAGTATLIISGSARGSGVETMKIARESIDLGMLFSHANTFDPQISSIISPLLMDFLFDSPLMGEIKSMTEMFFITDTQFFQVFRALFFQQTPIGLSGTNGHDIFRFTEICNMLTDVLFKHPNSEVQQNFLSTIRTIIKELDPNTKLHQASDEALLSGLSHTLEMNKKLLSDKLLQEHIRHDIAHPEELHSRLSVDDLALNAEHFQYSLSKGGNIEIETNPKFFSVDKDLLKIFSIEDIIATLIQISKKPLHNSRSELSISYYDLDSLIEDLYAFCETGTLENVDYNSLLDIHDRDLSLESIVKQLYQIPAISGILKKRFAEDAESCLWFVTKKFFADLHKQFEKAGIPNISRKTKKNSA